MEGEKSVTTQDNLLSHKLSISTACAAWRLYEPPAFAAFAAACCGQAEAGANRGV